MASGITERRRAAEDHSDWRRTIEEAKAPSWTIKLAEIEISVKYLTPIKILSPHQPGDLVLITTHVNN